MGRRRFAAVLFDFQGTVAQVEHPVGWVVKAAAARGHELTPARARALAEALTADGWPARTLVPPQVADQWPHRDLSPPAHRACYTAVAGLVDSGIDGLPAALYERLLDPDGWRAYPDTVPVLTALRRAGLAVALVSNVGFDLRPVLAGLGLAGLFDALVLSYEVGVCKPDPAIFTHACAALGVAPDAALMVGDTPADAGAVAAGCAGLILPASPAGSVHGLNAVLDVTQVTR